RTRTPPKHLRDFCLTNTRGSSQRAALVRDEHDNGFDLPENQVPGDVSEHQKRAADIPELCSADFVSPVDVFQPEPLSIHGHSIEAYQRIYHSVLEPILTSPSGQRHKSSLPLSLNVKQQLWDTLGCPVLEHTELPGGRLMFSERFSTTSRGAAPRFHLDVLGLGLLAEMYRFQTSVSNNLALCHWIGSGPIMYISLEDAHKPLDITRTGKTGASRGLAASLQVDKTRLRARPSADQCRGTEDQSLGP
ncbi:hypothetical protein DNTS_028243, partial [Danionella cerebrum]